MLVFSIWAGGAPPIPGYKGGWDIVTSRREVKTEPWGAPVLEGALNGNASDIPHYLSPDGCELWLIKANDDSGDTDIFVARRPR